MNHKLEWAKEYQQMLKGARQRNFERFERGIEEIPTYLSGANVQAWLEELSNSIIRDEEETINGTELK